MEWDFSELVFFFLSVKWEVDVISKIDVNLFNWFLSSDMLHIIRFIIETKPVFIIKYNFQSTLILEINLLVNVSSVPIRLRVILIQRLDGVYFSFPSFFFFLFLWWIQNLIRIVHFFATKLDGMGTKIILKYIAMNWIT